MRLCQIGCGEHARVAHGPSQARCARGARGPRARRLLRPRRRRARSRSAASSATRRAYTDPAAMLEAERPDAVVVVVPVERTVAVGSLVLERGLPLLLEKPPGETVAEVDRLIAAAERGGRAVPHQVAFNRRFAPLVRELRRRIEEAGPLQHLHYEMTRVERRDPDFSTTAIHGLDAVRYLAGCDYAEARFRYRELPELGRGRREHPRGRGDDLGRHRPPGVLPGGRGAGRARERARARPHALPPRADVERRRLARPALALRGRAGSSADLGGDQVGDGTALFELGGFYRETVAFLDAVAAGRAPVAEPARVPPVGGDRRAHPAPRRGVPGLARDRQNGETLKRVRSPRRSSRPRPLAALAAAATLGPTRPRASTPGGSIGPGGGGTMRRPAISPHDPRVVVLGCDMTGAYVTGDGGASWRMFNLGSVPTAFAFDPSRPQTLYAGAEAVYRSDDAGRTWRMVLPDPAKNTVARPIGRPRRPRPLHRRPRLPRQRPQRHASTRSRWTRTTRAASSSPRAPPTRRSPGTPASPTLLLGSTDGGRTWSRVTALRLGAGLRPAR